MNWLRALILALPDVAWLVRHYVHAKDAKKEKKRVRAVLKAIADRDVDTISLLLFDGVQASDRVRAFRDESRVLEEGTGGPR